MGNPDNESQTNEAATQQTRSGNATYEIRVKDHLDPCWWKWFEGWSLANLADGEVSLSRSNVDQSALHGALNKIRDLNLTLLFVTRIDENEKRS
jgi:hypothetical protein